MSPCCQCCESMTHFLFVTHRLRKALCPFHNVKGVCWQCLSIPLSVHNTSCMLKSRGSQSLSGPSARLNQQSDVLSSSYYVPQSNISVDTDFEKKEQLLSVVKTKLKTLVTKNKIRVRNGVNCLMEKLYNTGTERKEDKIKVCDGWNYKTHSRRHLIITESKRAQKREKESKIKTRVKCVVSTKSSVMCLWCCEALNIPHLRVNCQTICQTMKPVKQTKSKCDHCQKDYVNLKDPPKKAAVHQSVVKLGSHGSHST